MQTIQEPGSHLIRFLVLSVFLFVYSSSLQIGETCSRGNTCDSGLRCSTCEVNGNTRPRCSRIRPLNPISEVKGLPFNRYSWLTTHNSFAQMGFRSEIGSDLLAPMNQEDNVTTQLHNGVRGLMLDMYDFMDDIWLCHSFNGRCLNITAFQPAVNVLREIQTFLESNPKEIITIFIEDYVRATQGLSRVFNASGLNQYRFPVSRMPTNGSDWPTVDDMIEQNQRLVLFTSVSSKEDSEGIAYTWRYVVESQYGNDGMNASSCRNRNESPELNTNSRSLVLMNYFSTNPNWNQSCADNSANLKTMMQTCHDAAGDRWPNFIAVDFYQRNDGGGAPEAVDEANGQLTCGCRSVAYCRENATFGTCDTPVLSPPPPASLSPTGTTPSSRTPAPDSAAIATHSQLRWLLGAIFTTMYLLSSVF